MFEFKISLFSLGVSFLINLLYIFSVVVYSHVGLHFNHYVRFILFPSAQILPIISGYSLASCLNSPQLLIVFNSHSLTLPFVFPDWLSSLLLLFFAIISVFNS